MSMSMSMRKKTHEHDTTYDRASQVSESGRARTRLIGSATRGQAAQDGLQYTVVWLAGDIAGPTVCAKWGYGGRGSLQYMVCAARGPL